ncbi:SCO family protein [Paraburkholderia mimosarum]|uniref:SCO family protein n=1 Tax=Paraburkholderia mimosarum TaxID=312026 RepID=UPI0039C012AD
MFDQEVRTRPDFLTIAKSHRWTRRALLRDIALATLAAASSPLYAQHGDLGIVNPPARLDDFSLVDQQGTKRTLNDFLQQGVTALQTIYTGCGSVCPLQGALFSAIQDRIPQTGSRHPIRLLSIGIDPLSDSPSALRDWLTRFNAGSAWNAATPSLKDVDRMRLQLSGSTLPLGNIADHSTQIYCFDANQMLRYRSADLPSVDEICDVIGKLGRL